jgi:hypothetical protein
LGAGAGEMMEDMVLIKMEIDSPRLGAIPDCLKRS